MLIVFLDVDDLLVRVQVTVQVTIKVTVQALLDAHDLIMVSAEAMVSFRAREANGQGLARSRYPTNQGSFILILVLTLTFTHIRTLGVQDIGDLEVNVWGSRATVVFISRGYFASKNCLREFVCAMDIEEATEGNPPDEKNIMFVVCETERERGAITFEEALQEMQKARDDTAGWWRSTEEKDVELMQRADEQLEDWPLPFSRTLGLKWIRVQSDSDTAKPPGKAPWRTEPAHPTLDPLTLDPRPNPHP